MSTLQDGADALYALVERDKAFIALADVLSELGSLDQAIAERKAALAEVTQQHEAAKALLAAAQAKLAEAQAAHAKELAAHEAKAAETERLAAFNGARLVSIAKDEAAQVVQTAKDESLRIQKAHAASMAQAAGTLAELNRQIDAAHATLDQIHDEHARVTQATGAMREAAQALLDKE